MTSAKTNYGTLLAVGSPYTVLVGEIVTIDPPELIREAVEATYHALTGTDAGWREQITGGLSEVAEFSATINFTSSYVATAYADMAAGTKKSYQVQFPSDTAVKWTFDAIITKLKASGADAASPEALQMEITFQPTGLNVKT